MCKNLLTLYLAFATLVLTASVSAAAPKGDQLLPNGWLFGSSDDYLEPPNHRITFHMQTDCNLVVYTGNRPVWDAGTEGKGKNCALAMQTDGNLVIYRDHTPQNVGTAVWDSGTHGQPGAHLIAQGDGNVVIYLGNHAVWETGIRVVPAGSYLASCKNVKEASGTLFASCSRGGSRTGDNDANLPNYALCKGDIQNYYGKLVCAHPPPRGSYTRSCGAGYVDDEGTLNAYCDVNHGAGWVSLRNVVECKGDIVNNSDGYLECSRSNQ